MTLIKKIYLCTVFALCISHIARAEGRAPYQYSGKEGNLVMHVRAGGAFYGYKNEYKLGSTPVEVDENEDLVGTTVNIEGELSYFLSDHFSFAGSMGYHPQQKTADTWTVNVNNEEIVRDDEGRLSLLPFTLLARYHIAPYGALRPYIGAGMHYTYALDSYELGKTDPSAGLVLNAGTDWWWSPEWGLSLDAKKYFMSMDRDLAAIGVPLKQELKMDPLVVSAGLAYRFNP